MVEIGIFCHDSLFLPDGNFVQHTIPCKVLGLQIRSVHRIMTRRLKDLFQGWGEMGVDEDFMPPRSVGF